MGCCRSDVIVSLENWILCPGWDWRMRDTAETWPCVIAAASMELTGGGTEEESWYIGFEFWGLLAENSLCKAATSPEVHALSISWLGEAIVDCKSGLGS